jgi:hypothetical protein
MIYATDLTPGPSPKERGAGTRHSAQAPPLLWRGAGVRPNKERHNTKNADFLLFYKMIYCKILTFNKLNDVQRLSCLALLSSFYLNKF